MRAVVAGGVGLIGSRVCELLLDRGDQVVCLDNLVTGSRDNLERLQPRDGFVFVEQDVTDEVSVDGPIDAVLHLASPASPADFSRIPLEILRAGSTGTVGLAELALDHGATFVLASTSEVYGDPEVHPQPESYWGRVNPVGPRSVYDEAKRFAEATTMAYRRARGLDVRVIRIFNTYGPGMRKDDGRVVPTFLAQASAGKPLTVYGDGSQTRSFCYVDDMALGILTVLGSAEAGPVNLGNPDEIPVRELAEMVVALLGSSSAIETVSLPVDDPARRCPDISLARSLGWEPTVGLAEGLERTAAHLVAQR